MKKILFIFRLIKNHFLYYNWRNYKYSGAYIRRKIDELKTKWYSSRCYLRYYNDNKDGKKILGLTTMEKVEKDEMVALFSDSNQITEASHYLRNSNQPNCYVLSNGEVYAAKDLEPSNELTIDFSKINRN
jgi:hypothetical protein